MESGIESRDFQICHNDKLINARPASKWKEPRFEGYLFFVLIIFISFPSICTCIYFPSIVLLPNHQAAAMVYPKYERIAQQEQKYVCTPKNASDAMQYPMLMLAPSHVHVHPTAINHALLCQSKVSNKRNSQLCFKVHSRVSTQGIQTNSITPSLSIILNHSPPSPPS